MAKQRHESARIYQEQSRPELAENELAEAAVIEEYLPKQLSDEELTAELKDIIAQVGQHQPRRWAKSWVWPQKHWLDGLMDEPSRPR